MIEVHASYTFDGSFYRDDAAIHAAGRASDFSGCGFGQRDMGWVCKSEFEAERIKRALSKIGLTCTVTRPNSPRGPADGACHKKPDSNNYWICHYCGSMWSDMVSGLGWIPLSCPDRLKRSPQEIASE